MTAIFTACLGSRRLATGPWDLVTAAARPYVGNSSGPLLIVAHVNGQTVDFDGEEPVKPGRGRPRLGVTSAEVTLLPRHWDWLAAQPARASATLRRLVEEAMAREPHDPKKRRDALGRILWAVAGNEAGFEEEIGRASCRERVFLRV